MAGRLQGPGSATTTRRRRRSERLAQDSGRSVHGEDRLPERRVRGLGEVAVRLQLRRRRLAKQRASPAQATASAQGNRAKYVVKVPATLISVLDERCLQIGAASRRRRSPESDLAQAAHAADTAPNRALPLSCASRSLRRRRRCRKARPRRRPAHGYPNSTQALAWRLQKRQTFEAFGKMGSNGTVSSISRRDRRRDGLAIEHEHFSGVAGRRVVDRNHHRRRVPPVAQYRRLTTLDQALWRKLA